MEHVCDKDTKHIWILVNNLEEAINDNRWGISKEELRLSSSQHD